MRPLNTKKENLRKKLKKFRKKELQEFFNFIRLNVKGNKDILLARAYGVIESEEYKNTNSEEEFNEKIEELLEGCKIKIRIKEGSQKYVDPLPVSKYFPLSIELRELVRGQKFSLSGGKQTVAFILSPYVVNLTYGSRNPTDNTALHEIQFSSWNYTTDKEWNDLYLCLEVNGKPVDVPQPSPHIIYITSLCHEEPHTCNKVTISSPYPESLRKFAFRISLVKRLQPSEAISLHPPKKVYNRTTILVTEYMVEHRILIFPVTLINPESGEPIRIPCRSSECKHPEVFDLLYFLNEVQHLLQWHCPVCMKIITYADLQVDKTLQRYSEEGASGCEFYKRPPRKTYPAEADGDVKCLQHIIQID